MATSNNECDDQIFDYDDHDYEYDESDAEFFEILYSFSRGQLKSELSAESIMNKLKDRIGRWSLKGVKRGLVFDIHTWGQKLDRYGNLFSIWNTKTEQELVEVATKLLSISCK